MTSANLSNASYMKVNNQAGQLSDLSVADASVFNLVVSNLVTGNLVVQNAVYTRGTVVAYAPTSFATLTDLVGAAMLNVPGGAPATVATDPRIVTLPAGAMIVNVLSDNNGTAITTTGGGALFVNVNPDTFNGIATPAPAILSSLNTAINLAPIPFAGNSGAVVSAVAGENIVNVSISAGPNDPLLTGDLRVVIEYMVLN